METKKVVALIIAVIIIIAIAVTIGGIVKKAVQESSLQDLRTNMLLIQGKAKTYAENVNLETANLSEEKEEDNTKITEVKNQKLKGTALENCGENIKAEAKKAGIEDTKDYYNLSEQDLKDMQLNIKIKEGEYYLVKYNLEDTEVVYTKGYKYEDKTYYKLSELKNINQNINATK